MSARIYFKGKIAIRRLLAEQRMVHDMLLRHGGDDVLFEIDPTEHDEDLVARWTLVDSGCTRSLSTHRSSAGRAER